MGPYQYKVQCLCCRAGEEVTISYGAFPNDVFLLFFGFVPTPNPHDAVPLFADIQDLVTATTAGLGLGLGTQRGGPSADNLSAGSPALGGGSSPKRSAAASAAPEHARPERTLGNSCSSAEQELLRRLPPGNYSRYAVCSQYEFCDTLTRALTLIPTPTPTRDPMQNMKLGSKSGLGFQVRV